VKLSTQLSDDEYLKNMITKTINLTEKWHKKYFSTGSQMNLNKTIFDASVDQVLEVIFGQSTELKAKVDLNQGNGPKCKKVKLGKTLR